MVVYFLTYLTTNRKVAGSIPAGVSGFFIDIKSIRSHYGPGVDPASNTNEYREYFLGIKKRPVRKADNLPPSCAVVTKSGSLNFLESSGPVQACNGTVLPLLNFGTMWRWVVGFTQRPLFSREIVLGTRWIGSWVGFTAGLNVLEGGTILAAAKSWPMIPVSSTL